MVDSLFRAITSTDASITVYKRLILMSISTSQIEIADFSKDSSKTAAFWLML
jgi:hypothetical protein